jgi:outer membrane protein assembly factor BamB
VIPAGRLLSTAAALALLGGCSYIPWFGSDNKPGPLPAFTETAKPRIAWQVPVGGKASFGFTPAVTETRVYAASPEGTLLAIDLGSGKQDWRMTVAPALSTGVGLGPRLVLVGTAKGEVLAYSPEGKAQWISHASSEVLSPPEGAESTIAVWSGDGRIYGLSSLDGKRQWVWQQSTPSLIVRNYAGGVINRGGLFTGLSGGKMLALDIATGAVGWEGSISTPKGATELERISDVTSLPRFDDRQICAAAYQGRVACFDLARGTVAWTRDLSSFAGIAMDNRHLYLTDDKGNVHALDKANGASVWKQDKLAARRPGGPQVMGDYVSVVDAEGYVHLLARNDGMLAGRVATDGTAAVGQPVQVSDGIVFQSRGGNIYRIAEK